MTENGNGKKLQAYNTVYPEVAVVSAMLVFVCIITYVSNYKMSQFCDISSTHGQKSTSVALFKSRGK